VVAAALLWVSLWGVTGLLVATVLLGLAVVSVFWPPLAIFTALLASAGIAIGIGMMVELLKAADSQGGLAEETLTLAICRLSDACV